MDDSSTEEKHLSKTVNLLVRIGVLAILIGWSWFILQPFISILLWSLIIAIVLQPAYSRLKKFFRGRGKLAAITVTGILLLAIVLPALWLSGSIFESFDNLREVYSTGKLIVPPPGDRVKDWPGIAKPVIDAWQLASDNLEQAIVKYQSYFQTAVAWTIRAMAQTGLGLLQLIVSIIVAGVLLSYGKEGGEAAEKIFIKLAGTNGQAFLTLSEVTIRNTVKGVLGVAIIQSLLAGVGLVMIGIPFAGLWFLACMMLAILQIGVGPILIPAIIYVFATHEGWPASLFAGWSVLVLISDNVLKPLLLGRNSPAPMLVVLLGSIGGFIANGFLGLFLGPVILSLGYNLLIGWMKPSELETQIKNEQ